MKLITNIINLVSVSLKFNAIKLPKQYSFYTIINYGKSSDNILWRIDILFLKRLRLNLIDTLIEQH
jgi:hypothetical protein